MGRAAAEAILRGTYEARAGGDVDGVMRHFAEDAHFSLAGSSRASQIPLSATGISGITERMKQLISAFRFREVHLVDLLVEDDRAAAHWRVKIRSNATGQEMETELVDLVRFEGGRIVSFRQFADTALAAQLLGS